MYEAIKERLQAVGELMVMMSDGQKFELHLHNTRFDDDKKLIELNAGTETYWLRGDEVVYMWVHRVKE